MKRRGFTLIELLVVVAIIALLIAILLPSLGKARELSNRAVCAANVRGIGQSMIVYAGDNNESYPYNGTATVPATPPTSISTSQGGLMHDMFMLVSLGQVAPKQFNCKSDPASTAASTTSTIVGGTAFWVNPTDSTKPNMCYSYSFAYQYASGNPNASLAAFWRNTVDSGCPISADMNPGGVSTYPKKLNSMNHQGDGQNVGFADAHAEFNRTNICGENSDDIYNGGVSNQQSNSNVPGSFDTDLSPCISNTSYDRK